MDVTLWTLDFSDKIILPQSSETVGYISMNAKIEFCGSGSCELVFRSRDVEEFARAHPEGFFLFWGKFQGYITDWQFKNGGNRLFGSHLNSIIYKAVFPPQDITSGKISKNINELVTTYIPWLNVVEPTGDFPKVEYKDDRCSNADKFIQEYLTKASLGYAVYAKNRELFFEILQSQNNPLELSGNNLNAYEEQEDFSNKNVAYVGWYRKSEEDDGTKLDEPVWKSVKTETKNGIYNQEVILSASSPKTARDELEKYKLEYTIACKTRNLSYLDDYKIGDIIRYQKDNKTVKKVVSAVELWSEGSSYHEEPQLTDYKEE
jgi:hypothetical protein